MMPSSPERVKQNKKKKTVHMFRLYMKATSPTANIISVAKETSPKKPIKAKMASHIGGKHLILRNETLIL